jgi:hypothetical protein
MERTQWVYNCGLVFVLQEQKKVVIIIQFRLPSPARPRSALAPRTHTVTKVVIQGLANPKSRTCYSNLSSRKDPV